MLKDDDRMIGCDDGITITARDVRTVLCDWMYNVCRAADVWIVAGEPAYARVGSLDEAEV